MKCYFVAVVCVFVCQFNCECVAVFVLQLILMVQFEIFAPWNNPNGIAELEATIIFREFFILHLFYIFV